MQNTSTLERSYFEKVYEVVRMVPRGRVCTYGIIADYLALGSARMVGWALNHCKPQDQVPAHRIVNRNGELTGRNHWPHPDMMAQLLESEGVKVKNNKVVELEKMLWRPE